MINLQELEKEIDALLESETTETLRDWLNNNKANHVDCYVDAGGLGGTYQTLIVKDNINEITVHAARITVVDDCEGIFADSQDYGIAA